MIKVSIITVCFDSKETIESTIKSVLNQNHDDLEYIIIDGGSTDSTLEIIKKYQDKIAKIISEPDKGLYDAMNKGIRLATGEVVGILNSDDCFFDDNTVSTIAGCFTNQDVDACYGDIVYVDRKKIDKKVRFWKAGDYRPWKINNGWIMPHPAFFVKKKIYERYGLFYLDFKIAADYELMLRFLLKGIKMIYINRLLIKMREGGQSAKDFKSRLNGWRELRGAWRSNGRRPPLFFITRRIISKITQYFIV